MSSISIMILDFYIKVTIFFFRIYGINNYDTLTV